MVVQTTIGNEKEPIEAVRAMSSITDQTKYLPKLTTGIHKENMNASENMIFEEDIDESMIEQEDLGIKLERQESYKQTNALKPQDDKSVRDFTVYASEMEIISKTRNTVISMMLKNSNK